MSAEGPLKVLSVPRSELRAVCPSGSSALVPNWPKVALSPPGSVSLGSDEHWGQHTAMTKKMVTITCPGLPLLPLGLFSCPHSPHTCLAGEGQHSWLEGATPNLRLQEFPAVGLELLEFQELEGHILDGELQEVPETRQVLEGGHGECSGVLQSKETEERQPGRSEPQQGPEKAPPALMVRKLNLGGWGEGWQTGRRESPGFSLMGRNT